ncbi:DUF411 domain-containing protein [Azospirillum doebereinerae]
MTRRRALAAGVLSLAALIVAVPGLGRAAAGPAVTVWKAASCECCEGWVRHMREAGFGVTVRVVDDVEPVKRANGVPEALDSCHTALVDGYVVEGHVPASDVRRLLSERPQAKGLSAPGMPQDAPGMDMRTGQSYEVVLFGGAGGARLFARH